MNCDFRKNWQIPEKIENLVYDLYRISKEDREIIENF